MTLNRLNENVPVVMLVTVILTYISFEVMAVFKMTPPKLPLLTTPTVVIPLEATIF